MTILSVTQAVALRVGIEQSSSLFSAQGQTYSEMQETVSECVAQIVDAYDWSVLRKTATLTGDGVTTEFPLTNVSDFRRLVRDAALYSSDAINYPFGHFQYITDTQQWLAMETNAYPGFYGGAWAMFGGSVHIRDGNDDADALGDGTSVKFVYVSNNVVKTSGGTLQAEFTSDTDTFVLNERLLKLCMIWNWKAQHGQSYAAEMDEYQLALQTARMADNNPQSIRSGGSYWNGLAPARF